MIGTSNRKRMMRNSRILFFLASLVLLTAILGIVSAGCADGTTVYDCYYPIVGRVAHDGTRDACCHVDACPCHCLNEPCHGLPLADELLCELAGDAGTDATIIDGGTSSCSGSCVPIPPFDDWQGPGLLWLGPEGTAPACPAGAPVVAYQGHDGLNTPPAACGTCSCSASAGGCAPPLSFFTSSKPCGDASGMTTPFDGPPAWDGSCTANDCISPDPSCVHPMSVQSLTSAPLVLSEQGCTPSSAVAQDSTAPSWTTAVLACRGTPTSGLLCSAGQMCVQAAAPPDFALCIYQKSDASCPDSYPEKHLVYAGFDDQRSCSDCACGAPLGSSCKATLSVFQDGICSLPFSTATVGSSARACFDLVPADPPLGSKTVTALIYEPGSCSPSGGAALGKIEATGPSTFCCLAS